MPDQSYTEEELNRYFNDPTARRSGNGRGRGPSRPSRGLRGFFYRRFDDPKLAQAAFVLSLIAAALVFGTLALGLYTLSLTDELPTFEQLDNPDLQFATVAYTSDGQELARYAFQNRSWVTYDAISPHVINGLLATEDHRFYDHWGVDVRGIAAAAFEAVTRGDLRGASTVPQQLARNLYRQQIGREVTVERKLKEMVTAVQLERRYTKREIIEMYLNTVEYVYNAFGIEAAARTFFNKPASDLDALESATLVGMLQNPSYYNPVRFPEHAQERRNQVLANMARHGFLDRSYYVEHRDDPVVLDFNRSAEVTLSFAPYFAEHVRNWLRDWGQENGFNIYEDGLVVYTTLDARLQEMAAAAVKEQMEGLQKVVDYEWSERGRGINYANEVAPYQELSGYTPFGYFWSRRRETVDAFIRETTHYQNLRSNDVDAGEALAQLRGDAAFMDSLKAEKTRLEGGLVAIDPRSGYVKAWVGGRELSENWYDHVSIARRQPGSTFKPFVYTAAIDNGYSPYYRLPDSSYTYTGPYTNEPWQPGNFGESTGDMLTLREALATSNNLITARVITQLVNPSEVARYARRMGIESELEEVAALGLGTSDVSLLEMTSAYGTLAAGGLHYDPVVVTLIEDRHGNVLYEATPAPEEALSEETAYTVVDMLRGVIDHPLGTGQRIRWQWNLGDFDLAAKTGTTQNSADGWFMLMHPDLVTGAWVGFDDRRVAFRTNFWGQGAHNALFLVGDFLRRAVDSPDVEIANSQFPTPSDFGYGPDLPAPGSREPERSDDRRVGW